MTRSGRSGPPPRLFPAHRTRPGGPWRYPRRAHRGRVRRELRLGARARAGTRVDRVPALGIICDWHPQPESANANPLLAPATTGPGLLAPRHANVSEGEVTTVANVAIKPLEDRVVVKPLDAEQTTASGLVIPDTAKEKPQEGTVLAVGPGRFENGNRLPLDVKEGDVVLYSKYGGTEVKYNGEEYLVLSARDLLAVVSK